MTLPSSADVLGPFLHLSLLLRLGGGRKLQHRCVLTFLKMGQKNLLAVQHFKDIVMNIRLVFVLLPEDGCREPALNAVAFARDPTKLDGLSKASSVPGRIQTAVASPIGSSTDLNPMVPRPKLWLTNLSATTAGRDLACWRLKSHMVGSPFPGLGCGE